MPWQTVTIHDMTRFGIPTVWSGREEGMAFTIHGLTPCVWPALNAARLRAVCDHYGMPLMIEPLVLEPNDVKGGYQVDGNKKLILPLVRQARELGADVIKADPTEHAADYHEVVQAARCPILVRGGGKKPIETVFTEAHAYLAQGAHGLVYGRNIYQHPNPGRIVRAFMALIHEGATAERALAIYEGAT